MSVEDDLRAFSVSEAAQRLSISEVELRRVIKRGEIRVKRAGKSGYRILVPAASLRDYLAPSKVPEATLRSAAPPGGGLAVQRHSHSVASGYGLVLEDVGVDVERHGRVGVAQAGRESLRRGHQR